MEQEFTFGDDIMGVKTRTFKEGKKKEDLPVIVRKENLKRRRTN